ncbi:hypothetical protein DFH08DRAFT_820046 [Mycena albidolilacea]|uniref:Uncharacterized protein n=1 Tax=Mycena albidolilacea TaxID=1033008 RepID=A0AAD7EEK5_9AGAR|nr:hypothetical protein DFH08DRAFT_820046 [Mycena albidolilacea]
MSEGNENVRNWKVELNFEGGRGAGADRLLRVAVCTVFPALDHEDLFVDRTNETETKAATTVCNEKLGEKGKAPKEVGSECGRGEKVVPYVITEPYKPPQWEKLFLPSDFTGSEQTKLGLESLEAEELKLRQGEANDILRSLNVVHGQEKNTRAVQRIKDVQTKIQSYIHKYQQACTAMIAFGCNPQDPKFGFPELRDEDIYTKNVDQPHNLVMEGRLKVGFGDRAVMKICLKQRKLNIS